MRRVFYSFHFLKDHWRAAQVRNMGVVEGDEPLADNDWEALKKKGDDAIRKWIDSQIKGKSCEIVLIGEKTAGRKWINYEIKTAWNSGKGVMGLCIHNLKDENGDQTVAGRNPFEDFVDDDGKKFSGIVKAYNPPYTTSINVYDHIKKNIADWVEKAIDIRSGYSSSHTIS